MHPQEPRQLLHRSGASGIAVGNVQLNHFVSGLASSVPNLRRDENALSGHDLRRGECQITVLKLRVGKPVSETIPRSVGQIHIVREADATALVPGGAVGMVVVQRNLSSLVNHRHRQSSAGVVRAGQHVRDGFCAALSRAPSPQDGVQAFVGRVGRQRTSAWIAAWKGLP